MKVTLTSGIEIEIRTPPVWRAYDLAEKKYPQVKPPIVTETTVSGEEISMIIEDDPAYLAAKEKRDDLVSQAAVDMITLFALKDVEVPDDFDVMSYAETIRYADQDWMPRDGAMGRKLDYIEFELLAAPQDFALIQQIVNDLSDINQEEIAAIASSFQR